MKKSFVFGILLSICMTIPAMADTSNSGMVIEPISSLQEQLEEMTEEQKVIAIEKYYSVEDEKIVETAIERLELRVTEDELMKIRDRMEEAGISSLTAYLVRMATHGYVIVMDLSDLKEILRLLQISGNNLNQYAKKANETGSIYHEDIEEMKNNQKEILQEMRKVLDRLTAIM